MNYTESTENIYDFSHNFMALMFNSFINPLYNTSAGLLNYSTDFLSYASKNGLAMATNRVLDDVGQLEQAPKEYVRKLINTPVTGSEILSGFTDWRNYEPGLALFGPLILRNNFSSLGSNIVSKQEGAG